jgi:hypothetical protein
LKLDNFTAWVQAVLSGIYLIFTFAVIVIYELTMLGIWATEKTPTQSQEKTFDSMVSWMTGGALIVLYFWLQRAKAQTTPDPDRTTTSTTTTTTPTPVVVQNTTTGAPPNETTTTIVTPAAAVDADSVHDKSLQDRRDTGANG